MTVTISNRVAGAIAITAAEGGINYWAEAVPPVLYQWTRWQGEDPLGPHVSADVDDNFVFYTIRDKEEDPPRKVYSVTPLVIAMGLGIASAQGRVHLIADTLEEMDADLADVIIQLGLFKEVRYG